MNERDNLIVITDSLRFKYRLKKVGSKMKDSNNITLTFFDNVLFFLFFSFFIAILFPIITLALFFAIPFYPFLKIADQQSRKKNPRVPELKLVFAKKN